MQRGRLSLLVPRALLALGVLCGLGRLSPVPAAHAQVPSPCAFVLGFAVLRDLVGPATTGDCLENQQTSPENGDAYQRSTGGLLVWRKADNWTAFTDGYRTWLNGPRGLQVRLNVERYRWEGDAGAQGTTLLPDTPLFPSAPAPAAPAPPARGVSFVSVSGAGRNGTARVTVQTVPYAACSIGYVTPLGTQSVAQGLAPQTADASGRAAWAWMIGVNTRAGTGTVTVTCDGSTATAPIQVG